MRNMGNKQTQTRRHVCSQMCAAIHNRNLRMGSKTVRRVENSDRPRVHTKDRRGAWSKRATCIDVKKPYQHRHCSKIILEHNTKKSWKKRNYQKIYTRSRALSHIVHTKRSETRTTSKQLELEWTRSCPKLKASRIPPCTFLLNISGPGSKVNYVRSPDQALGSEENENEKIPWDRSIWAMRKLSKSLCEVIRSTACGFEKCQV